MLMNFMSMIQKPQLSDGLDIRTAPLDQEMSSVWFFNLCPLFMWARAVVIQSWEMENGELHR